MRTTLARVGHVALGIVYVVIGIVAARVAFLGARDRVAGMPGALRVLLGQRHGLPLLTAVAVGLTAYALWRASEVFNPRRPFLARVEHGISFIGYAALAVSSVRLVFRAEGRPADVRRAGVAWLLAQPWGATVLRVIGLVVMAGGAFEVFQGLTGRVRQKFVAHRAARRVSDFVIPLSRIGLAARGIVFLILGMLILRAVRDLKAAEVRGIGGALRMIATTPLGPPLMGVVALGLIAYGLFMGALAFSRRLV